MDPSPLTRAISRARGGGAAAPTRVGAAPSRPGGRWTPGARRGDAGEPPDLHRGLTALAEVDQTCWVKLTTPW